MASVSAQRCGSGAAKWGARGAGRPELHKAFLSSAFGTSERFQGHQEEWGPGSPVVAARPALLGTEDGDRQVADQRHTASKSQRK